MKPPVVDRDTRRDRPYWLIEAEMLLTQAVALCINGKGIMATGKLQRVRKMIRDYKPTNK